MALTKIPVELVLKSWALKTWESGLHKSYFNKFTGTSADSIIQIKEELKKSKGDCINIPLLMPLSGAGIMDDNILEGNEEALIYRDFDVFIHQYRNAVRIAGKFEEQKTQINMRTDARDMLSLWLARKIDDMIFAELSDSPTSDRVIYGGTATSESAITPADKFDTMLIGKAKRMAMADEDTMLKPVRVDGKDCYVMVIDQWQARDLITDPLWVDAQQSANVRGESNPIFSGALGMYNGVIIHTHNRVLRTDTGSGGAKVGHALFLGAQAAVFAVGNEPEWYEDTFDYGNQFGVSFGRIFGIKKSQFKYDGTNDTDFGVINVLTSSADD